MSSMGSKTRQQKLFPELIVADTLWTRMKGLLGTKDLSENQTMWIHRCNSIHTFFMNYAIDCVFVNRNLQIVDVVENIVPGRIVFPRYQAISVFEMKAGTAKVKGFYKGEELYVDC